MFRKYLFWLLIGVSVMPARSQQVFQKDTMRTEVNFPERLSEFRINSPNTRPIYTIKENVVFAMDANELSGVRFEVSQMEILECNAILRRDTVLLTTIWSRDFTLDTPMNRLVAGKSSMEKYIAYSRIVERINHLGDFVYTSGHEFLHPFSDGPITEEGRKRNFSHTWNKKSGTWKLVNKSVSLID
jgi:hypothetical protein